MKINNYLFTREGSYYLEIPRTSLVLAATLSGMNPYSPIIRLWVLEDRTSVTIQRRFDIEVLRDLRLSRHAPAQVLYEKTSSGGLILIF